MTPAEKQLWDAANANLRAVSKVRRIPWLALAAIAGAILGTSTGLFADEWLSSTFERNVDGDWQLLFPILGACFGALIMAWIADRAITSCATPPEVPRVSLPATQNGSANDLA